MSTAQGSSERELFAKQLLNVAFERAKRKGLNLDSSSKKELHDFITIGVSNMSKSQLKTPEKRQEAEHNIIDLIEAMNKKRKSPSLDYNSDDFETQSLLSISLRGFCPRFPFC